MPINFVARNVTGGVVIVENIGKLAIVVTNMNGFYLENTLVEIKGDNFTLLDLTDASGRFVAELPEGAYYVEVARRQWRTNGQVPVRRGETTIAQFLLNFVTVSGFEVSPADAFGYSLLSILTGFILYIIKKEYSIWRRRRIQILSPGSSEEG